MSHLLELVDRLIGSILAGNIYTDTDKFSQSVSRLQTPEGAFGHIPNADPRNLNFQGADHPPGTVPESIHDRIGTHANRGEIYNGRTPPLNTRDQAEGLRTDSIIPGQGGSPIQTPTKINRQTIYGPTPGNNPVQSLIDFHLQGSNVIPSPSDIGGQTQGVDFPKTPADNPTPTHPGANGNIENTFTEASQRPLNFRNSDDAPDRKDLVASFHSQKYGPNASFVGDTSAQNHGLLKDNRYDDSNDLIGGNFKSGMRGPVPQPLSYMNLAATGNWLRNIGYELGIDAFGNPGSPRPNNADAVPNPERITKGITFIATQFLLASFNSSTPQSVGTTNAIWNPLSIGAAIPLVGGFSATNITIEAAFAGGHKLNVMAAETTGTSRLLLMRKGLHVESSPVHRLSKLQSPVPLPGFLGDLNEGDTFDEQLSGHRIGLPFNSVEDQIDDGFIASSEGRHTNLYTADNPYSAETALFPIEKAFDADKSNPGSPGAASKVSALFDFRAFPGGPITDISNPAPGTDPPTNRPGTWVFKGNPGVERGIKNQFKNESALADSPGIGNIGVVPARLPGETNTEDLDETEELSGDLLPDAGLYLPFMFEDLRDSGQKFLYFRAFLKGDINETFTPDWQADRYYGRADQVPIYKGTVRSMNFSFDVAAFQPSDLSVIWAKLQKLQSMVYPSFNTEGFMKAGPMIRIRIGDLFAAANRRGLPGYITGMDWSYPDGIWNMEKDRKVPRLITVSISFTVIHEGNPGIYPAKQWSLDTAKGGTGKLIDDTLVGGSTFGTFKATSNASPTQIKISQSEIRGIFKTVRGK